MPALISPLEKLLFIFFTFLSGFVAVAQSDTSKTIKLADSLKAISKPAVEQQNQLLAETIKAKSSADSGRIKVSRSKNTSAAFALPDSLKVALADTSKIPSANTEKSTVSNKKNNVKGLDSFYIRLLNNPFFKPTGKPVYLTINERERQSKDEIFYLFTGLFLFLAFVKLVFSKYFLNVFKLFFQPAYRQKQTREQLHQKNFPSLLLNLFFVFTVATYISLLLAYNHILSINFWQVLLATTIALLLLYSGKFLILSFAGWVFNVQEATETYIFSVYLINKILGIILIPFTLLIAFSQPSIISISVTISLLLIFLLLIYRYLASYAPVRKAIKVSILHFFLYILAFEITPLLLIYKTVIIYMSKSL